MSSIVKTIKPTMMLMVVLLLLFGITYFLLRASAVVGFSQLLGISTLLFILALSWNRKAYWLMGFPLVLIGVFYLPTGLMYGFPSADIVAALFYTNPGEAMGYLSVISRKEYAYALALLLCGIGFGWSYQRYSVGFKKTTAVIAAAVLVVLFMLQPLRPVLMQVSYPVGFFKKVYEVAQTYRSDDVRAQGLSLWSIQEVAPAYDNYVLVIGESARRDYLSAFGYPQETTPFMNVSPGTLVEGLVSPGASTVASLTRMLTLSSPDDGEPINYRYSLMDLAKAAGLKTYWISAQGKYGSTESPVSIMGQKSDFSYFAKIKGSNLRGPSDASLLPIFKDKLFNDTVAEKRLLVLHLFGSHADVCDRVPEVNPKFHHSLGRPYECYQTSIEQTDRLLAEVAEALRQDQKEHGRSFSMVYFSDHGQGQFPNALRHSGKVKQGFEVPLFRLNSDDTQQNYIKADKSGFNMVHGLAHWLGVKAEGLKSDYDLFSDVADQNVRVDANPSVSYADLADDPATE